MRAQEIARVLVPVGAIACTAIRENSARTVSRLLRAHMCASVSVSVSVFVSVVGNLEIDGPQQLGAAILLTKDTQLMTRILGASWAMEAFVQPVAAPRIVLIGGASCRFSLCWLA